jgi:hypothetical protein
MAARAAARVGGTPESLAAAREALAVLEELGQRPGWRVESAYAAAAIHAAMAAAQDERAEMAIYLVHARGLSEQLALAGASAVWPLPIDEMEGDLWLEVDRYAEAAAAFDRAQQAHPTGFALVGLARARARLDDEQGACDAYRRAAASADAALLDEARAFLARGTCAP